MGTIWEQPSPSDFDAWVELLVTGEEPSAAAKQVGFTCSAFRRTNPDRHAEAIELSREARAHYADEKAEQWALADDADDRMRERWLARWNGAYRRAAQVEVSGELGVQVDISDALERLNQMVSAAAVRHAAGARAELDSGGDVGAGAGVVGVGVGEVVGTH